MVTEAMLKLHERRVIRNRQTLEIIVEEHHLLHHHKK